MEKEELNKEFRELAEPLVRFLQKNYHPHAKIIINYDSAEIVVGEIGESFDIPD